MSAVTPFGDRELLPGEYQAYDRLVQAIRSVFQESGFDPIQTPAIEYDDAISPGLGEGLKKRSVRFLNAEGELVVLRPDPTTAIARMVASRMSECTMPLKLWYMDSVFRREGYPYPRDMESYQAGIELIGDPSVTADADVISACLAVLDALGVSECSVDIGHISFVSSLSDDDRQALLAKDYVAFGQIPQRGSIDVLAGADVLAPLASELRERGIENRVSFNKGLVKGISYYTGMIFEVMVPGIARPVVSGGRYDGLLARFGSDFPAVGCAIEMDVLYDALCVHGERSDG